MTEEFKNKAYEALFDFIGTMSVATLIVLLAMFVKSIL